MWTLNWTTPDIGIVEYMTDDEYCMMLKVKHVTREGHTVSVSFLSNDED